MGEAAPARTAVAIWVWRCAAALAVLGLALVMALLAARKWWPDRYLGLLPTPGSVIREAVRIDYTPAADEERSRPPVAAILQARFRRDDIVAAFIALIAARAPSHGLAELAGAWIEQDPGSRAAILQAVLSHRSASAPEERALAREAYLAITHASLYTWLRSRQEADGCWPAAEAPVGPGRWRPGRVATTAFVMKVLMEGWYDHKAPSRGKKIMQRALAALQGQERPDGRCVDDPRDQAVVAIALCELEAMTDDLALRPFAQRALAAARQDLDADGDFPWQRDTALAVLQLLAQDFGRWARLDTGHTPDDPYRALRRCWAVENADAAAAPRFRWREDGLVLAEGGVDGLAAASAGFFFASRCQAGPAPAELTALRKALSSQSPEPDRWSPLGFNLANDAIMAGPLVLGTPERRWLEAADRALNEWITIGDPLWDATWGSAAKPDDAATSAILGETLVGTRSTLSDRVFWEHQPRHPLP